MKIRIKDKLFKKILKSLYKTSYSVVSQPELNSFFFEAKEDCLTVFAKNTTTQVEKVVPISDELVIITPGKVIVNAFIVNEIVQKTDQEISFEVLESTVAVLKTEKYKTKINTLDVSEFWTVPRFDVVGAQLVLLCKDLNRLINQVCYAAQTKEGRAIFRGINFRTKNKELVVTATDGSRIARQVLFPFDQDLDIVLSTTILAEVNRIAELEEVKEIHATLGEKGVFFQIGNGVRIFSKIIAKENAFPNTENQFFDHFETAVECKNPELIAAIEKAGIIFEKNAIPTIVFRVENNQFFVSSLVNSEIGFFEEHITTSTVTGSNQSISLQAKFVLSALKSFVQEEIVIGFSADDGPVLLMAKNNPQLKALILPLWV